MNDQKLENQLILALNSTEEERIRSGNLNIGYDPLNATWEVIIKYTGEIENKLFKLIPPPDGKEKFWLIR